MGIVVFGALMVGGLLVARALVRLGDETPSPAAEAPEAVAAPIHLPSCEAQCGWFHCVACGMVKGGCLATDEVTWARRGPMCDECALDVDLREALH